ncbi:CYFA0S09e00650g1_1 [Cyberlindnera fabianii]|uniref:CYFA0S09e00650g1_1 n=1 Tax=Cyberlindnera fabianii TaxID=36022 RepID=A0A061B5K3_CYBFA|nr:CYFA0S09e00650g1_1 [Cyberlindnera fabianii]
MFRLSYRQVLLRAATRVATRAQSTKTTTSNSSKAVKSAVAAKVSQKGEYNTFSSNQNINQQEKRDSASTSGSASPSSQKPTPERKVKKDYSALPKVPSTSHLNPQKIIIDSFYAGYRPLAMQGLKQNLLPSKKKTLFDLGLEDEPVWAYSASGLDVFPEWDHVPMKQLKNLTPFKPPMTEEQKAKKAAEEMKMNLKEASQEQGKKEIQSVTSGPKVRKGRVKPVGHKFLLKKKKYVI